MGKQNFNQPGAHTFPDVVVEYYKTISWMCSEAKGEDGMRKLRIMVDNMFQLFNGYMSEDEIQFESELADLESERDNEVHAYVARKLALISLFLYRVDAIPQVSYAIDEQYYKDIMMKRENASFDNVMGEKFDAYSISVSYQGRIPFDVIINNHLMVAPRGILSDTDLNLHTEVQWAYLAPYITERRMDEWQRVNSMFGSRGDFYNWALERAGVCSKVRMDANFNWDFRAVSYEDMSYSEMEMNNSLNAGLHKTIKDPENIPKIKGEGDINFDEENMYGDEEWDG